MNDYRLLAEFCKEKYDLFVEFVATAYPSIMIDFMDDNRDEYYGFLVENDYIEKEGDPDDGYDDIRNRR